MTQFMEVATSGFVALTIAILTSLAATFFSAKIAEQFAWFFHKKILGVGYIRSKNHFWKASWHVKSDIYPDVTTDEDAVVRVFMSFFYAKFKAGKVDCVLRGRIHKDRYILGHWKDNTEHGYFGVFHFEINPEDRNLEGKWLGWSKTRGVKSGNWKWVRKENVE